MMDKVKRGFSWKKSEPPNNSRDNADSSSDGIPKIRRQVTLPPPTTGWVIEKVSAYNLEWDHLRKWLIKRFKDDGKGFNEKQAIDEDAFVFYSPKRLTEADRNAIETLRKDIEPLEPHYTSPFFQAARAHMSKNQKRTVFFDADPVLSNATRAGSMKPSQVTISTCVTQIARNMAKTICDAAWLRSAIRWHGKALVRERFRDLLRNSPLLVVHDLNPEGKTPSDLESQAVGLICCYSPQISYYVMSKVQNTGLDPGIGELNASRLKQYGLDLAHDFRPATELFSRSSTFRGMYSELREILSNLDSPKMAQIKATVSNALEKVASTSSSQKVPCGDDEMFSSISLKTDWNPIEFLETQFGKEFPQLRQVVAYTGLASTGFAAPCLEYMVSVWPSSGERVMKAIEKLLYGLRVPHDEELDAKENSDVQESEISMSLSESGEVVFEVSGSTQMLVEVAQQVAWISSALRLPPQQDAPRLSHQYCNADIVEEERSSSGGIIHCGPQFTIRCRFGDVPFHERSCWMSLVSHDAVLALDFPIPVRREERGLEMSLGLLTQMCGIQHAIVFQGGVVMKGPTFMLLPISRKGNIIQWHLVVPEDGRERLSYMNGIKQCKSRALIDEVDLEALQDTRAIVGWWSEARTRLGDPDVNYENIDYSTAEAYEPTIRFSKIAVGVQQFATAQFEATLGPKDSGYQMKWGNGAYEDTIFDAKQMRVVLYDTADSRAWFTNGAEVILHMIRTRSMQRPFMIKGNRVDIPSEESVAETLHRHKDLELISDGRRPETLETLVIRYFGILEDLLALDLGRKVRPDTATGVPFQNQLVGHEFMALVDRMSISHVKKCVLAKTSGGWSQLVQDCDALTLFGSGFEDLIQPTSKAEGLCHRWRTMPKEKDYLGIKVETLLDLYKKAGCRLSQEYLTPSHLKWHRGASTLFEPCESPGTFQCQCDRVQEITPSAAVGKIVSPGKLKVGGAVIFGRTSLVSGKRNAFAPASRQIQASSFYGQANVSLESSIKGIEMEIERGRVSFTGEST